MINSIGLFPKLNCAVYSGIMCDCVVVSICNILLPEKKGKHFSVSENNLGLNEFLSDTVNKHDVLWGYLWSQFTVLVVVLL